MLWIDDEHSVKKYYFEPISKLLKRVTPAKVSAQKRAENTGFYFSPELQQQTFEIGSFNQRGTTMKKVWLAMMMLSAMACMGMQGNSASRYPVQKISVTVNVPDSGWRVRILEVHRVKEELWVVSELYRLEGKSSQVISSIEDQVEIPAPSLPIVHYIIGKTWGWSAKTDSNRYIHSRKEIADKFIQGECIYQKKE